MAKYIGYIIPVFIFFIGFEAKAQDTLTIRIDTIVKHTRHAGKVFNSTELGVCINYIPTHTPLKEFGITTINGFMLGEYFGIGFGAGLYGYDDKTLFPVFVDARLYFSKTDFAPYLGFDVGTIIGQSSFNEPFIGCKIKCSDLAWLNLSVGLSTQDFKTYVSAPHNSSQNGYVTNL
ncbi:MAG: hypothetical protein RI955_1226, partial [Bacteroidota bacterium]